MQPKQRNHKPYRIPVISAMAKPVAVKAISTPLSMTCAAKHQIRCCSNDCHRHQHSYLRACSELRPACVGTRRAGKTRQLSPRWAVPWPCAHEFCAVISNQKWRSDALDAAGAVAILRSWASAPNFRFLGASHQHLNFFAQSLLLSGATGGQVHDARIAATCLEHNVTELWSADRDFSRFPGLRTRNPLSAIA